MRLEKEFLEKTNDLINEILNENTPLKRACAHLCSSTHAKRLRPLMCLYFYWLFYDDIPSPLVKAAVASEFIHVASLMHDDIVDNADQRRGKLSVNKLYGNEMAVLAGDFLLTESFSLLKDLHKSLNDQAIVAVREMTKSAMMEIISRREKIFAKENWTDIALGKTGGLFAWCGFAALNFKGPGELNQKLWQAGLKIGLIFQIADDIKDFSGDKMLKDACKDIRNKEHSLPIVLAIENDPSIKDAFLEEDLDDDRVLKIKSMVENSNAIIQAKNIMALEMELLDNMLCEFNGTLGKASMDKWLQDLRGSL